MKLVIELDEKFYKYVCEEVKSDEVVYQAIQNGTPLPKEHGRLIDADRLNRIMYRKAFETDSDMQKWDSGCWIRYKMFENSMKEMSTIIEADVSGEGR